MARRPDPLRPFIIGDSIGDILAEARITPGRRTSLSPGANSKLICPACGGGKSREESLSLKVDDDGQGATWHCKRGTCGGNESVPGNGRIESSDRTSRSNQNHQAKPRPVAVAPKLHKPEEMTQPPEMYRYFAKRGISAETVDEFGIYATTTMRWAALDEAGKPRKDGEGQAVFEPKPTIVFPYRWGGTIVNRKFRSKDKQFRQDKDSERTLFNVDSITSDDEVIFVEGEMDVLALHEAGFRQIVSMPDGTDNKLLEEDDPKRLENHRFFCLDTCQEAVAKTKRILIATDADTPGQYLAEELARRLGKVRCWSVTWPEGCKDANDVLRRHVPKGEDPTPEQIERGKHDLREAVAAAQPWPLAGVWSPAPGALMEFLYRGMRPRGLECGVNALDDVARIPEEPGRLTVVAGIPSHGKTSVLAPWLAFLVEKHDRGIVWCSPEDGRPEVAALRLVEVLSGQPTQEAGGYIPADILAKHEDWIRRRISFLWSDDAKTEMTIDWVLDRSAEIKRRYPRHYLVLDPWSDFEHQMRKQESETQYINRTLIQLKKWGRSEGMGIVIAAHPQKMAKDPKTKKWPVINGYDISGSANWFNRADLGVTVYRGEEGIMEIHNWKAKYKAFGKQFGVARLKLDARNGRISSAAAFDYGDATTGDET